MDYAKMYQLLGSESMAHLFCKMMRALNTAAIRPKCICGQCKD